MIVLDASVLIAHLDAADAHHARAARLLLDLADRPLGASPITVAEVLVGPARDGKLPAISATLDRMLTVLPLETGAPDRLAQLRVDTGVRMPDCCVLLAAEQAGGGLVTFDAILARVARQRGIAVYS